MAGENIGEFNYLDYLEEKSLANGLIMAKDYWKPINWALTICQQSLPMFFAIQYINAASKHKMNCAAELIQNSCNFDDKIRL